MDYLARVVEGHPIDDDFQVDYYYEENDKHLSL
jgi:hypothetical protein